MWIASTLDEIRLAPSPSGGIQLQSWVEALPSIALVSWGLRGAQSRLTNGLWASRHRLFRILQAGRNGGFADVDFEVAFARYSKCLSFYYSLDGWMISGVYCQSVVVERLEIVAERRSFVKCLLTKREVPGAWNFSRAWGS